MGCAVIVRRVRVAFVSSLLACALLGAALPAGASAQDDSSEEHPERRAQELFRRGDLLYSQGRYEDAVIAFQEAYSLSERPLLLYNIANAEERLGRWSDALATLQRYLPDAAPGERADIEQRIRSVEMRLANERALAREQARDREQSRIRESTPPEPGAPGGAWVLAVGGGLVLGSGVAFGIVALGARGDADVHCREAGDSTLCSAAAADALSQDLLFSVLADVSLLVGAVATAVGVYLIVRSGTRRERERRRLQVGVRSRGQTGAEVSVALEL